MAEETSTEEAYDAETEESEYQDSEDQDYNAEHDEDSENHTEEDKSELEEKLEDEDDIENIEEKIVFCKDEEELAKYIHRHTNGKPLPRLIVDPYGNTWYFDSPIHQYVEIPKDFAFYTAKGVKPIWDQSKIAEDNHDQYDLTDIVEKINPNFTQFFRNGGTRRKPNPTLLDGSEGTITDPNPLPSAIGVYIDKTIYGELVVTNGTAIDRPYGNARVNGTPVGWNNRMSPELGKINLN